MIYLNNAATSWPKPDAVAQATADAISNLPGAANRGGIEDFDVMAAVRGELATLLHASHPERFALGANATWALNTAIFGVDLQAGDTVLTTKAEHNSVLRPLFALSQRGVQVHYLDTDASGRISPESWQAALVEHRPKLAVFSHASNVTGALNDAAALVDAARSNGVLTLVDMSQTAGWCPIDLEGWGVDLAAFTGHKYLLGPQGTGGLYVRDGLEIDPYLVGGTGIHSDRDTMPDEMPLHLEAGTGNEPSYYGLLAALRWANENPICEQYQQVEELLAFLREELGTLGAAVIDPTKHPATASSTPVLSFTLDGISPHDIGEILLDSYDVIVRTGLHCAPRIFDCLGVDPKGGTVRVSLSRFTTRDEIESLIGAMHDIVDSKDLL
jgi:selenocysteine lyase/cysteine desulfurase